MGHYIKLGAELSVIFLALMSGGTLYYMDSRLRENGTSLKEMLDTSLDTVAWSVKLMKDMTPEEAVASSFKTI